MNSNDLLGWVAAAATLATFYCQGMVRLRSLALVSNVCFIGFALSQAIWPVLVLHLLLLPLNVVRLLQARRASHAAATIVSTTAAATAAAGTAARRVTPPVPAPARPRRPWPAQPSGLALAGYAGPWAEGARGEASLMVLLSTVMITFTVSLVAFVALQGWLL